MKFDKRNMICLLIFCFVLLVPMSRVLALEKTHYVTAAEFEKNKPFFDDPRPLFKELDFKKLLTPKQYEKLVYDVDAMKQLWTEVVGFNSTNIVNKIAPDIQPGVYTYKDKEKYSGFKTLMLPEHYDRFNPGAPPHAGNYPEIRVIPTRQYYWSLPISEATKKYAGTTKLDSNGYLIEDSYTSGIPFPKPAGDFKAQQILYNWVKRYMNGGDFYLIEQLRGFTKDLKADYEGLVDWWEVKLQGRVISEPYGWYDERAREKKETSGALLRHLAPRDNYGTAFGIYGFALPEQEDNILIYINFLRRIRKMSASDSQDAVAGQDVIYEDKDMFNQKLSPKRYPYKMELVEEREYLMPARSIDGSIYMSSKGLEYHNIEFERRPIYVIKMTQLSKNYVYSSRMLYIDKETFMLLKVDNYDQKGRLYRTGDAIHAFNPQMGRFALYEALLRDYVDLHSNRLLMFCQPAPTASRSSVDMGALFKAGK